MLENKSLLSVKKPPASSSPVTPAGSVTTLTCPKLSSERYLLPTANIYPSKATLTRRASSDTQSQSDTNVSTVSNIGSNVSRTPSVVNSYAESEVSRNGTKSEEVRVKNERRVSAPPMDDLDVQSIINERRPSKLKSGSPTGMSSSDQYGSSIQVGGYGHVLVAEEKSEEISPVSASIMSDSMIRSTSLSVNGSGNGSGSAVVHIPGAVCATVDSEVRIYVDDTDSTSSNGHRKKRLNEETTDASTTISSVTAVPEETDEIKETEERSERATSAGPSDPS